MHRFSGWGLGAMLAVWVSANTPAQELPQITPEGEKTWLELMEACENEGVFKKVGKGSDTNVQIDLIKMQATLSSHRKLLTPAVQDVLVALLAQCSVDPAREEEESKYLGLLEGFGEEMKDERALGFSAFFAGRRNGQQFHQLDAATFSYKKAAKHFAVAKEPMWKAIALNNLGFVLQTKGDTTQALKAYQEALTISRKLYPDERYPQGHPLIASCLNNLGGLYKDYEEYIKAQKYIEQALKMRQKL